MTEAMHPLLKACGLPVRGLELEPVHDRGQHHSVPVGGGVRGQLQEQLVGVGQRAVCSEAGSNRSVSSGSWTASRIRHIWGGHS